MKRFLAIALLLSPLPAPALAASPSVEVANANWSFLPNMKQRSSDHLSNVAIARIHQIAQEGKCVIPGARRAFLELDLPFAAHFNPDGAVDRIVIQKLGCQEAEGILGGVLLKMIQGGDYKPDGSNEDGWYRGTLSFTVSG
jgi:hypothetical protein